MVRKILRIIAYLILFLANLWFLWYLHGFFNLMIASMMVFLPVLSAVGAKYVSEHLSAKFDGPVEPMQKGDEYRTSLKINNPTFFGIMHCDLKLTVGNTFYGTKREQEVRVPLRARKGQTIIYPITVERCGLVSFELQSISIEDWFGFFTFKKPVNQTFVTAVFPRGEISVDPDLNGYMLGMEEVEESTKKGSDFSEVQDVREYQPGDKIQNIHWKLSAKKDILMVKERVSMSSRQLFVLPEIYDNSSGLLEEVLDCTFEIVKLMMVNGQPVSLMWWSESLSEFRKYKCDYPEELTDAYRMLYYDKIYDDPKLGGLMYQRVYGTDSNFLWVGAKGISNGETMMDYGTQVGVHYGI